jgi:Amidohydrolase family
VALVSPDVFFTVQAEAARLGLSTVGHLPVGIDVRAASDGRMKSIEHLGPGAGVIAACCDHEDDIQRTLRESPGPRLPALPRAAILRPLIDVVTSRLMEKIVINPLLLAKPENADLINDADQSFNEDKTRALGRLFAANATWQCPTLIRIRTQQFCDDPAYRAEPNNRFASDRTLGKWRTAATKYGSRPSTMRTVYRRFYTRQLAMVRIFDEVGVKMLAGSDVGGSAWEIPGFALHQEFDQLATAGLSPLRILQMATVNAAEFLGRTDTMGTVEPGKNADLVLLAGNPLEDACNLHHVSAVVHGGRHYSARELGALANGVARGRAAV